ncbi:MAG: hypothetical protein ACLS6O_00605 [Bifidobacterium sp.]
MVPGLRSGRRYCEVRGRLAASTTVTFNKEGDYVLKLTASDGEKEGSRKSPFTASPLTVP